MFYFDVYHMLPQATDQTISPVLDPSNPSWNYGIQSFRLPPLTRIMLADVDAGSDTPSLAGKVLKWRKESGVQGDFFLSLSLPNGNKTSDLSISS